MPDYDEDNDGRYPDETAIEVGYPDQAGERDDCEHWPWLPVDLKPDLLLVSNLDLS